MEKNEHDYSTGLVLLNWDLMSHMTLGKSLDLFGSEFLK